MADKRRALGRGLGALFPEEQKEPRSRATDVFFSSPKKVEPEVEEHEEEKRSAAQVPGKTDDRAGGEAKASQAKAQKRVKADTKPGAKTTRAAASKAHGPTSTKTAPAGDENPADGVTNAVGEAAAQDAASTGSLLPVPGATFGDIPVDAIIPNTRQPREVFDEDDLQELADSIAEVGVLQPIVVRRLSEPDPANPDAQYELIMGERRWRASQRAGKQTIPAIVRHTDDADLLRDALLENLHRANLNALEEAAAYQQLLDDFQCTQEELSRRIARSRPQISNTLRLLKLPPLVQRRVAAGVLSAGHARALLGLLDPAAMERLAQRIVAEGLSVRQVEEIVALGEDNAPSRARGPRRGRYTEELNELAGRLSDRFNTRVKVNMGATKGKIAIEFATIDDLNRILDGLAEDAVTIRTESGAETDG
ncbi:ParB/RepB/Spo0J family partition protein [Trueperella sp.]|uniref:ParB/RepB/Spo0J family partition protein n=1 Tax=Trueperella sp. TaxID=2699835 RepID=UPI002618FB5A|nr:ParB/RepB/Spo0J family partition protein [Trueperella sp.]